MNSRVWSSYNCLSVCKYTLAVKSLDLPREWNIFVGHPHEYWHCGVSVKASKRHNMSTRGFNQVTQTSYVFQFFTVATFFNKKQIQLVVTKSVFFFLASSILSSCFCQKLFPAWKKEAKCADAFDWRCINIYLSPVVLRGNSPNRRTN